MHLRVGRSWSLRQLEAGRQAHQGKLALPPQRSDGSRATLAAPPPHLHRLSQQAGAHAGGRDALVQPQSAGRAAHGGAVHGTFQHTKAAFLLVLQHIVPQLLAAGCGWTTGQTLSRGGSRGVPAGGGGGAGGATRSRLREKTTGASRPSRLPPGPSLNARARLAARCSSAALRRFCLASIARRWLPDR